MMLNLLVELLCCNFFNQFAHGQMNLTFTRIEDFDLPQSLIGAIAGIYDNKLTVFGGGTSNTGTKNTERYEMDLNNIKIINGLLSYNFTNSVWNSYSASTISFPISWPNPYPQCKHNCYTQIDNLIYITSPITNSVDDNTILVIYDLITDTFNDYEIHNYTYQAPNAIIDSCIATNNTHLFIIGGINTNGLIIYDTINDIWTTGSNTVGARKWSGCSITNDLKYIIVSGGYPSDGWFTRKIDKYDIELDRWDSSIYAYQLDRTLQSCIPYPYDDIIICMGGVKNMSVTNDLSTIDVSNSYVNFWDYLSLSSSRKNFATVIHTLNGTDLDENMREYTLIFTIGGGISITSPTSTVDVCILAGDILPTSQPTSLPTSLPTSQPTSPPTLQPTSKPTNGPTAVTVPPTTEPTNNPTEDFDGGDGTQDLKINYYIVLMMNLVLVILII
eukprot:538643_1